MAPFSKCKFVLILEFCWILYSVGSVVDTCKVTIHQDPFQEVDHTVSSVNITCSFFPSGCHGSPEILWFRYRDNQHEDLCKPNCNNSAKFKTYENSLQINNLDVNDSAIYICGIAFSNSGAHTSKKTGDGTVLVKRGTEKYKAEEYILMTVLSSLLFLYSTTIFAVFIFYESKSKLKKRSKEDLKGENHTKTSGRTVCRAIAQELYKKRYAKDQHQPDCLEPDDTIYQNR
uniref:Immunoglobulin superfamily member 6 n=1 Tax=Pelusios castaneus TaxID=367368 RepID=A0A8C8RB27_9SAUR